MKRLIAAALFLTAAPLWARMEDRTKELYDAADRGDLAAVKAILEESDQNVNVAYGKAEVSPLMLALRHGNIEMARLLVEKGADVAAVDRAGRPVLEYLRKTSPQVFRQLQTLILKTAADKNLPLTPAWEDIWLPDDLPYTAASSYEAVLPAPNIADGEPRTAWAGKAGEDVWLFINPGAQTLTVVNGYNKSPALFKANNRVKRLAVSVWTAAHLEADVSEIAQIYHAARLTPDHILELKDTGKAQTFPLPFDWDAIGKANKTELAAYLKREDRPLMYSDYVLRAEPLEVYEGTKYDDTCISELKAGRPWRYHGALAGDWDSVTGAKGKTLTFSQPWKGRKFASFLEKKPLLSGQWRVENGELVTEGNGQARRYRLEFEEKGGSLLLKLTEPGGRTETYRRRPD
ncbi:MAG TPA: hypothetical protein DCS63_06280 [Elusimicrobia bacterium]|nr:hypothetical protein [Elusimicrobiota bacterium]